MTKAENTGDTKYLFKRDETWWVKVAVPRTLRMKLGYDLRRSLHTHDLEQAKEARGAIVEEFRTEIEEARSKQSSMPADPESKVVDIQAAPPRTREGAQLIDEHIVEVVSDSGEGAQKCGQTFGAISGKMGNGVWTVEIIPAEIQPPPRQPDGASGNRIRLGSKYMTNMGNEADLVVAFNEQVLYSRIANRAYKPGTIVLLDNMWADDPFEEIQNQYQVAVAQFREMGLIVHELPMQQECLKLVADPRKGKNMFVLGMLCHIYSRDTEIAIHEIKRIFAHKGESVIKPNLDLFNAGYAFARENVEYHYEIPPYNRKRGKPMVVVNGNTALGLGVMAAGMEVVAMYPITPATSASHYLADDFPLTGGFVHQAEDEIAPIAKPIAAISSSA